MKTLRYILYSIAAIMLFFAFGCATYSKLAPAQESTCKNLRLIEAALSFDFKAAVPGKLEIAGRNYKGQKQKLVYEALNERIQLAYKKDDIDQRNKELKEIDDTLQAIQKMNQANYKEAIIGLQVSMKKMLKYKLEKEFDAQNIKIKALAHYTVANKLDNGSQADIQYLLIEPCLRKTVATYVSETAEIENDFSKASGFHYQMIKDIQVLKNGADDMLEYLELSWYVRLFEHCKEIDGDKLNKIKNNSGNIQEFFKKYAKKVADKYTK